MNAEHILLPVLAQVLLTLSVFVRLAKAKAAAAAAGNVDEARRALHADAWPDHVIQLNNNIRNQFEVPVLFYVVCIVLWALQVTSVAVHVLAWLFVISRVIHMVIHTGANVVTLRRRVFLSGCVLVIALTLVAVLSVLGVNLG